MGSGSSERDNIYSSHMLDLKSALKSGEYVCMKYDYLRFATYEAAMNGTVYITKDGIYLMNLQHVTGI